MPFVTDPYDPMLDDDETELFPRPVRNNVPRPYVMDAMAAGIEPRRRPAYEVRNGVPDEMPPPAPAISQPRMTAMLELAQLQAKRPLQSEHNPGFARSLLGGLAAAAQGAGEGYLATRGFRVPGDGGNIGQAITQAPYRRAMRDYADREDALIARAKMEQQLAEQQRREMESQARIGASEASRAAALARERRYNQPLPAPRANVPGIGLVDTVTGNVIVAAPPRQLPAPRTIQEQILTVQRNPELTPEQKKIEIDALVEIHNQMRPRQQRVIKEVDDAGNVYLITPGENGQPATVERVGDKPLGKSYHEPRGPQMTPMQSSQQQARNRATKLLQDAGGNIDQAITNAASEPIEVQQELAKLKRTQSLAAGKGSPSERLKGSLSKWRTSQSGGKTPTPPSIKLDLSQFER